MTNPEEIERILGENKKLASALCSCVFAIQRLFDKGYDANRHVRLTESLKEAREVLATLDAGGGVKL